MQSHGNEHRIRAIVVIGWIIRDDALRALGLDEATTRLEDALHTLENVLAGGKATFCGRQSLGRDMFNHLV